MAEPSAVGPQVYTAFVETADGYYRKMNYNLLKQIGSGGEATVYLCVAWEIICVFPVAFSRKFSLVFQSRLFCSLGHFYSREWSAPILRCGSDVS
jgi:hypothetical protein